jgi:twinkle protein
MISVAISRHITRNNRALSTFVSRHNEIKESDVRDFLNNVSGIELRETRDHFIIKDCTVMPNGFCLKPEGLEKADNQWKAYVKRGADGGGAGTWFCHRCGSKGSWYDMKQLGNGIEVCVEVVSCCNLIHGLMF